MRSIIDRLGLRIEGPPDDAETQAPLLKRLGWFVVLWVCGLCVIAGVAYGLRALILP